MITRRRFLETAAVAATAAHAHPLMALARHAAAPGKDDVLQWVDPRIGTGGHGHTYPGASVPFGAMQLSPDTFNEGWDWCSGYHLSDASIMGFSHTHLSGTGASDLLDFLVMPGVGEVKLQPGTRENPEAGYRSRFSHANETSQPGYYAVHLDTPNVHAELTATERVGIHRYTFIQGGPAHILVDLHHAQLRNDKSTVVSGELTQTAPDRIVGGHVTNAWGPGRHAYLALQVSKQPTKVEFFRDDQPVSASAGPLTGANLKAVLHFNTTPNEQVLVKVGISGVDPDGAAKNIAAEIPAWDFDGVRYEAQAKWRNQIGKIHADFANESQKKIFYTALYHMSLGPTLFDDVDGRYRGMDNAVHTLPAGEHNYTTFSLWDTFRAAHPAYTLLEPERVPQFVNTLIRMGEESPAGAPVWPLHGRETECMTGFHCSSVIAEAQKKGVKGPDYARAYRMLQRGRLDDVKGMQQHCVKGYIAADEIEESVSRHFEYCYDDWAMANIAAGLGMKDAATEHVRTSKGYKNNWDASVGFMRPKLADGTWASPFDPIAMGHKKKWRDYTESNAWQSTFALQNDPAGLIETMGGQQAFLAKLDTLFNQPSTLPDDAPPDIAGMVGQYAHGNEPSHHIAYLYVYAGAPHKAQARVRSLMDTMYAALPDGMQGNEDVGQMSAWFLLSALGFYPVDPVSAVYVLGSPLVNNATLSMGAGKVLHIEVQRKAPTDAYVQEFWLNGKKQDKAWFRHADIANGGTLRYVMSD